jgi:hypothetical protein
MSSVFHLMWSNQVQLLKRIAPFCIPLVSLKDNFNIDSVICISKIQFMCVSFIYVILVSCFRLCRFTKSVRNVTELLN